MKNLKILITILGIGLLSTSCNKEDDNDGDFGSSTVNIKLTDAPGDYDSVLIDIQQVELITDQGKHILAVNNPGIYNLLDFSNGVDTHLVSQTLPSGRLNQIRLILGNNNSVIIDSVKYPLTTPSAQQSGLKLNVHADLTPGAEYTYTLDFDAARSIVERGNGDYNLKPVIRVITNAISGVIEGQISPINAAYYSFVVNGNDTLGTSLDSTGFFRIIAVPAGNYDVYVLATPNFSDKSLSGVPVVNGETTVLDTINF